MTLRVSVDKLRETRTERSEGIMTTETRRYPVGEEVIGQLVSGAVGFVTALLGFVGLMWKRRSELRAAELESDGERTRAQIEADSSERIHIIDTLSARVTNLERHNAEQDDRIANLVRENAGLSSQNTLLREQNTLLKRQITALEKENDELSEEVRLLRDTIQGPISDALETLDDVEPPDDEV